jgi:hypothetical protein
VSTKKGNLINSDGTVKTEAFRGERRRLSPAGQRRAPRNAARVNPSGTDVSVFGATTNLHWTYDTALGGDDVFKNSFTLELARAGLLNGKQGSVKIFKHSAQEWICSLANGLFGEYRLNDATDLAQSIAPANVVTNLEGSAENIDSQIVSRLHGLPLCQLSWFRDELRTLLLGPPDTTLRRTLANVFRFDKVTAKPQLNVNHTRDGRTGMAAAEIRSGMW